MLWAAWLSAFLSARQRHIFKGARVSSGSASYYKGQSRKAQHRLRSLSGTKETRAQVQASILDIRGNVSPGPLLLPGTTLPAQSREHQSPRRFLYLSAILKVLKQKLQVINPSEWLLCVIFFPSESCCEWEVERWGWGDNSLINPNLRETLGPQD